MGLVIGQSDAFAAIDFETADYARDSACAVGIVRDLRGFRLPANQKA